MFNNPEQLANDMKAQNRWKGDDNLVVAFYVKEVQDQERTKEEGRPIFNTRDYVKIFTKGDPKNVPDYQVNDEIKQRFAVQWAQYREKGSVQYEGVPIGEWQGVGRSRAMELKALGIHTVEMLAEYPESSIEDIGDDGRDIRRKANQYLKLGDSEGMLDKIQALEAKITSLQTALDQSKLANEGLKRDLDRAMENHVVDINEHPLHILRSSFLPDDWDKHGKQIKICVNHKDDVIDHLFNKPDRRTKKKVDG